MVVGNNLCTPGICKTTKMSSIRHLFGLGGGGGGGMDLHQSYHCSDFQKCPIIGDHPLFVQTKNECKGGESERISQEIPKNHQSDIVQLYFPITSNPVIYLGCVNALWTKEILHNCVEHRLLHKLVKWSSPRFSPVCLKLFSE